MFLPWWWMLNRKWVWFRMYKAQVRKFLENFFADESKLPVKWRSCMRAALPGPRSQIPMFSPPAWSQNYQPPFQYNQISGKIFQLIFGTFDVRWLSDPTKKMYAFYYDVSVGLETTGAIICSTSFFSSLKTFSEIVCTTFVILSIHLKFHSLQIGNLYAHQSWSHCYCCHNHHLPKIENDPV